MGVLCYANDRYWNEDIFLHEFSHTLHQFGLSSEFDTRLQAQFDSVGSALFAGLYAGVDHLEYWAEGSQDWFDVNAEADPPNGIHNHVNTREELRLFDPGLYDLLAEVYPDELVPGYSCHAAP